MKLGNCRWETASYNSRLQITGIGLGITDSDQDLLSLSYGYETVSQTDNNGSLRKQTIDFDGLADPIEQNYTYDDLNRLKSAIESVDSTEIWNQTFNYDRFGNRTFDATYTDTFAQSNKVTNPTIDSTTNRITEDQDGGGNDYEYDRNGNLTFNAVDNGYVYDAENRLKEFFADKDDNDPYAVYEYDGNGNRVRKIVDPEGDAVETIFVYNGGGQLVAEYSTELAQAPKVSYLTQDHLGSPRVITDEDGEVVSRHDYLAYGEDLTQQLGAVGGRSSGQGYGAADEIRKKYTGYERDDESGLDYAKARYYDSFRGRYTSVDPLTASADVKNPQTFNRYTYVLNSPYKFTDPLGLISADTGACGSWCPGSNGWGGGLIDPYRAEGSTIQVGREVWYRQQQQDPPEPPPTQIDCPECLAAHEALHSQEVSAEPPYADPVFRSGLETIDQGFETKENDEGELEIWYSASWGAQFSMGLKDQESGKYWTGYKYRVTERGGDSREGIVGEDGFFEVTSVTLMDRETKGVPPNYSDALRETAENESKAKSFLVTVYGKNGRETGRIEFKVSVTRVGDAMIPEVSDIRVLIPVKPNAITYSLPNQ